MRDLHLDMPTKACTDHHHDRQQPTESSAQAASVMQSVGSVERFIPEDMDELLELTLLQALSKSVKDSDLPIPGSGLWTQHMLHCRPNGSTLGRRRGGGDKEVKRGVHVSHLILHT